MKMRPIVVYAPPYEEDNGGAIVLHLLVDKLREHGIEAYVRLYINNSDIYKDDPFVKPIDWIPSCVKNIGFLRLILNALRKLRSDFLGNINNEKYLSDFLNTPVANYWKLRKAIVVYHDSYVGDLWNYKRVVRWLLHKPGFFNKSIVFGDDEEIYYFNEVYKGEYELGLDKRLHLSAVRHDCYYYPDVEVVRKDKCYIVRKGKKYGLVADKLREEGKVVVDGMTHKEIGDVFRTHKYLVSYDTNTMYTTYAVMCGCIPVVLRPPMMPEKEFLMLCGKPKPGIAVGYDDIDRAVNTRKDLLRDIQEGVERQDDDVKNFIEFIKMKYPSSGIFIPPGIKD
jgi:hypothetical protein